MGSQSDPTWKNYPRKSQPYYGYVLLHIDFIPSRCIKYLLKSVQVYCNLHLIIIRPKICEKSAKEDVFVLDEYKIHQPSWGFWDVHKKFSFSALFTFDAPEFQIASFKAKHWTRAIEVCILLEYKRTAGKIINITVTAKMFCISISLVIEPTVDTTVTLPRVFQKLDDL